MYKNIFVVLLVLLGVTVAGCHNSQRQLTTSSPYHLRPDSSLQWHACDHGIKDSDCAVMDVPVDYSGQDKGTIKVGISRLKATAAGERIGTLFVNPGGPGGKGDGGLAMVGGQDLTTMRQHFDIIGFDPRGTGRGTQLVCDYPPLRIDYFIPPATVEKSAKVTSYQRHLVESCRKTTGHLIDHIGTIDVVKDMDRVREALGESTINFLGASYGGNLGYLYAQMFPTQLRGLIIDGDAWGKEETTSEDKIASLLVHARQQEEQLQLLDQQCKNHSTCHTPDKRIIPHLDELIAKAKAGHLTTASGYRISLGDIGWMLYLANIQDPKRDGVYDFLSGIVMQKPSSLVYIQQHPIINPHGNMWMVNLAVNCEDDSSRGASDISAAQMAKLEEVAPHMYDAFDGVYNLCQAWPVAPHAPKLHSIISPTVSALIIVNQHDPHHTLSDAQYFRSLFPAGRLLITDLKKHCSIGSSPCADRVIENYLITQRLPDHDGKCIG